MQQKTEAAGEWVHAWHFINGNKLRDGTEAPANGVELVHYGKCVPCESGLHASESIMDALKYAPGTTLCRVRVHVQARQSDKLVGDVRIIEWRLDASKILVRFAKECAKRVLHLWEPPQVMLDFLNGDDPAAARAGWAARAAAEEAAAAGWAAEEAAAEAAGWAARAAAAEAAAEEAAAAGWAAEEAGWAAEAAAAGWQSETLLRLVMEARNDKR